MGDGLDRPMVLGCATDRAFVGPTAAMLSSVDDNGDVAGATVLVADFGLTEQDRTILRDSAGRLGATMRFVAVDRSSPEIVALPSFEFPFPLVGRFILPGKVDTAGARLLLLDSDVVVNHSLRPLFALNMRGHPLGAVQDPLMAIEFHHHRKAGPSYFNAGVMLVDTDLFRQRGLAESCMRQLAAYEQKPIYIDQCAMNDVLRGDWLELDRRWNLFQTGYDRHFERAEYEVAHIIHFAGPKPWEFHGHPAGPVWNHHATRAQQKSDAWRLRINGAPVDREFVARQYQVLLGRELESELIADQRGALSRTAATAALIASPEFAERTLLPLAEGRPIRRTLRPGPPTLADRYWAADALPVLPATARRVLRAESWRDMLAAVVEDDRLMELAGLAPISARLEATTPAAGGG